MGRKEPNIFFLNVLPDHASGSNCRGEITLRLITFAGGVTSDWRSTITRRTTIGSRAVTFRDDPVDNPVNKADADETVDEEG